MDVEVDMYKSGSARDFITVGMPDTAVRESRERIKSALMNSGRTSSGEGRAGRMTPPAIHFCLAWAFCPG